MALALELIRPPAPLSFADGLALQQQLFDRILAARAANAEFGGGVILLEHTPTITLGRESAVQDLLASEATLRAQGIAVETTDRGGKITVHAPGQWVLYPVLDLNRFGRSVTGHIRNLEEVAIRAAARFGVPAERIAGVSGAWVRSPGAQRSTDSGGAPAREEKLAAVGIAVRRWIVRHGLCFNVAADMPVYKFIVPCGQLERGVTSLQKLIGRRDTAALMAESAAALLTELETVLDVRFRAPD
ncbi:MAG: lipoyl(octanoyl) transferase LipB [Planctomycetota bacterium]